MMNDTSALPFSGNVTLKRKGRDHPKIFLELELTDSLRNYDVINGLFDKLNEGTKYNVHKLKFSFLIVNSAK